MEGNNTVITSKQHTSYSQMRIVFNRDNMALHHHIVYEQKIMQAIRAGQEKELITYFRNFPFEYIGVLSKNHIRSMKNIAITTIAVAVRAAIEGGMYYELAYQLSDLHIQTIEELEQEQQIVLYLEEVLVELAQLVKQTYSEQYSKPIYTCINYIYLHLNEEITLDQLARLVQLHPKYVSYLFKRELGISLQTFIQTQKIEEAKKLLLYSNYSITAIAGQLNFFDQSHFTKAFKKITGLTPKEYQNTRDCNEK